MELTHALPQLPRNLRQPPGAGNIAGNIAWNITRGVTWGMACTMAGTLVLTHSALAGGFRLPDLSTSGMAMSNAVVANYEDPGAIAYNPAAMAFHEGTLIGGGSFIVDHHVSVTRNGQAAVGSDAKTPVNIPYLQFSHRYNHDWAYGINLNAPFGLETRWPDNTFAGPDPTQTRIKLTNFNPNVAHRIDEHQAISVGLAHYVVQEAIQNTSTSTLNGTGSKTGLQLGYLYAEDEWSVGANYRSAVTVNLDGALNGAIPVTMDLYLPWLVQVGARFKLTDALALEADIERVGWSKLVETRIKNLSGATVALNTNRWKDNTTYRLGASYAWDGDTTLHAGFLVDKTPLPDAHFTTRLPSANYRGYSIGLTQDFGDTSLQIGYQYLDFDDRQVNSSVPFGTYGADGNGTDAYNGNYKTDIQVLSIGLRYQFH